MNRLIPALLVLGLSVDVSQGSCECMDPLTSTEAYEVSAAVFLGEVVEVETASNLIEWLEAEFFNLFEGDGHYYAARQFFKVTFDVKRTLKGELADTTVVYTRSDPCGIKFAVGETYLVFAPESGGRSITHLCLRTKRAGKAKEELAVVEKLLSR